jgi:hypothetical protein
LSLKRKKTKIKKIGLKYWVALLTVHFNNLP